MSEIAPGPGSSPDGQTASTLSPRCVVLRTRMGPSVYGMIEAAERQVVDPGMPNSC